MWTRLALAGLLGVVVVPPAAALSILRVWSEKPSPQQLAAAYPPEARAKAITGVARLNCEVAAHGRLADCRVEAEGPEGFGFGAAALRLAPLFRLEVPPDWKPTGERLNLPIRFAPPN